MHPAQRNVSHTPSRAVRGQRPTRRRGQVPDPSTASISASQRCPLRGLPPLMISSPRFGDPQVSYACVARVQRGRISVARGEVGCKRCTRSLRAANRTASRGQRACPHLLTRRQEYQGHCPAPVLRPILCAQPSSNPYPLVPPGPAQGTLTARSEVPQEEDRRRSGCWISA